MSSTPFLPATLPLLPLPPPYVVFPHLTISYTLSAVQAAVVIQSISENARKHKSHSGLPSAKQAGGTDIASGDMDRMVGCVPVVDIERRIGRWATGELLSHRTCTHERQELTNLSCTYQANNTINYRLYPIRFGD